MVGSTQFCLASAELKCVSFVFTHRAALVAFHTVSCSAQWSAELEVATVRELSTTDLLRVLGEALRLSLPPASGPLGGELGYICMRTALSSTV